MHKSMSEALFHFGEAMKRYPGAMEAAPTSELKAKFLRKMRGLKNYGVRCANKALLRVGTNGARHIAPLEEPLAGIAQD